jgi:hypothetical protein
MGWTFHLEIPEHDAIALGSDDLTAGEDATIYAYVANVVPHHLEVQIHPAHCPVCRSAIAVTALMSRGGFPDAVAEDVVRATPRAELIGSFDLAG